MFLRIRSYVIIKHREREIMKNNRDKMRELLSVMFKIGCIGFGGGTALIPVIEEEVTEQRRLVDEEEFNKDVVIANITPGALPVEIASGIGRKVRGIPGMVLAASMMALPGTFLTVLIVSLINQSSDAVLRQILFASAGVTAYIIFMLIEYTRGTYRECKKNQNAKSGMFFMFLVFFLTTGKELYQIFNLDITPLFDISTVNILVIAFFIIFYSNGKFNRKKLAVSAIISVLYCLCVGKARIIPNIYVKQILRIAMVILSVYGVRRSIKGKIPFSWPSLKKLIREEICWIIFLFVLSLPALLVFKNTFIFLGQGLISALMSFGGGDAYLAVANGLFVNTGMIGYEDFYSKVVSVANALPGSILCKILSGVGYVLGHQNGGTVWAGYAVAISGFACSVAASGGTFSAVAYLYERFQNLEIFQTIKRYIRPIVAGLLLSVAASMLYQNMNIATVNEWPVAVMILFTLGLFLLNVFWKKRSRMRPIFMVLLSAAISLAGCNAFSYVL